MCASKLDLLQMVPTGAVSRSHIRGVEYHPSIDPHGEVSASTAPTPVDRPLLTPTEILAEQDRLEHYLRQCYRRAPFSDCLAAYQDLSKTTQDTLSYWVWVADGCPLESDYGNKTILANPVKPTLIHLPFLFSKGKNLVEQWMYCLQYSLLKRSILDIKEQVQQLALSCNSSPPTSNLQLQRLFLALPLKWQDEITKAVLDVIDMPISRFSECKERILKDVSILHYAKKTGSSENVLEKTIQVLEAEHQTLIERERTGRKEGFLQVLENPSLSRHQKRHCYDSLDSTLKVEVPSPPYYGYGANSRLHNVLGPHPRTGGTDFALQAPNATKAYVVLTYHGRERRRVEMHKNEETGFWEAFGEGVKTGSTYMYEIHGKDGSVRKKIDPFALECWPYHHPDFHYESVVRNTSYFPWTDGDWMESKKACVGKSLPMSIYKMHPGNWKKRGESRLNYRELADQVVSYCREMGFTHVELMGILEHPSEGSQGYQPLSLCAINSRHGDMYDFQHFVDTLHQNGIGVFVDFVGGHFCVDDFGLKSFDGSPLFEHKLPARAYHPAWGAFKFDYSRPFVRDYAHSAARRWAELFHIDGFRLDAVDSIIDMNNGRPSNECLFTNRDGSSVDLHAVEFLKDFTCSLHRQCPGTFIVAESSSHGKMSAPVQESGFGCDAKWAMGGMYDLLEYFRRDPIYRSHHQDQLIRASEVEDGEHVVYAFSHDQVAHGSGGLLHKMPGDRWRKFANLRLFFSLVFCLPGRKLLFMGDEVGQTEGWDRRLHRSLYEDRSLEAVDWASLSDSMHAGLQKTVAALNKMYKECKSLWDSDISSKLDWIDNKDTTNSVVSFHRGDLACVMNCTPNYFVEYDIYFPERGKERTQRIKAMEEVFNSDKKDFGGSDKVNESVTLLTDIERKTIGFRIKLPPLGCAIFKESFD